MNQRTPSICPSPIGTNVAVGETLKFSIRETVTERCSRGCDGSCPSRDVSIESINLGCEGATCKTSIVGGDAFVEVTADQAGTAFISFVTRDVDGRESSGSTRIAFAKAHHIAIKRPLGSTPESVDWAALAGTTWTWCPQVEDEGGAALYIDPTNLVVAAQGATISPNELERDIPWHAADGLMSKKCTDWTFTKRGPAEFSVRYKALERKERIDVITGADIVKAIPVVVDTFAANTGSSDLPIELDPLDYNLFGEANISLTCTRPSPRFALQVMTASGARALARDIGFRAEPGSLLSVEGETNKWQWSITPRTSGNGSIQAEIGTFHIEQSVEIVGRCNSPESSESDDAGADAARDEAPDGEAPDGESPDGESPDGESPDGGDVDTGESAQATSRSDRAISPGRRHHAGLRSRMTET